MLSTKTTTLTPNFAIEQSYEFQYITKIFIYTRIYIIVYLLFYYCYIMKYILSSLDSSITM